MQKNVPKYTPDWVATVPRWAEASKRNVSYALANDRRTLLWFANQRAVEYHPTLFRADHLDHPTHLVLDLDPPEVDAFACRRRAHLVRAALADTGLLGAVKTSGAKGVHVFVPLLDDGHRPRKSPPQPAPSPGEPNARSQLCHDRLCQGRSRGQGVSGLHSHGGATVAAVYSPRVGPACPSRSRLRGTTSTTSPRRLHRAHRARAPGRSGPVGRRAARGRSRCPRPWSPKATTSRSLGSPPCMRANAGPARRDEKG